MIIIPYKWMSMCWRCVSLQRIEMWPSKSCRGLKKKKRTMMNLRGWDEKKEENEKKQGRGWDVTANGRELRIRVTSGGHQLIKDFHDVANKSHCETFHRHRPMTSKGGQKLIIIVMEMKSNHFALFRWRTSPSMRLGPRMIKTIDQSDKGRASNPLHDDDDDDDATTSLPFSRVNYSPLFYWSPEWTMFYSLITKSLNLLLWQATKRAVFVSEMHHL